MLGNQRQSIPVSKGRTNYVAVENQFSLQIPKQRIGRIINLWNWAGIKSAHCNTMLFIIKKADYTDKVKKRPKLLEG